MKINKGISVLLASVLMGGMLVGCSNNSNSDTTKVSTKTVKEVTKDDTEVEVTKDKEKDFPPQDNNKSSEKQVNTKKDNDNVTVKKDTNQKETKSTKEVTQKKSNENATKDKSEKNNSTQKKTTSNTDTKETPKKEEPKQKGYWVTCSNGHKVWTVNGDYDCQQCYDDYMNQEDDETNECSICGGHVGVKQMCECDGTIHHRSCHVDAYTCPGCGRSGLNNDPDVYGCPYCGYPNEEHQESSDVEEYNDEVDIPNDTDEGINY